MRKLQVALGGLFLCLAANAQNVAIGSLTASGADCTTAGACITLQFEGNDVASASIQLSGTFTATVQFEASSDKGTTWVAISGTPLNSSTAVTSATTANTWKFNVASITNIRARCSAFTSAPTVVIRSSRAVANAIGGGGAVFASGGTTNNLIPKSNGSGALVDSTLSDNGTNVISTEAVQVPASGVAIFGAGNSGTGWVLGSDIRATVGGVANQFIVQAGVTFVNGRLALNTSGNPSLRGAGNTFTFGLADVNGVPASQTLNVQNAITGSNLPGSPFTIDAPLGTGTGAGASTSLNRALMGGSGTTAQTSANAFVVCESKTLSNTSATAQTLANIALASNSAGGARGSITVTATDGTNFDSETQDFVVSYVNKATVGTVGTAAITASTAANNSGSATIGMTATFAGTTLSIKATPVFTTIVPTTVTAYLELQNHGAGAVTCQ